MSKLKDICKIFIIESPSLDDLMEDRTESASLSEILSLAEIQHSYKKVASKDKLILYLSEIVKEIKLDQKKWGSITLHFSCHGNGNGIGLSNGDFVNWADLYGILKVFNDTLGYIEPKYTQKFVPVNLHFSSCEGFNAIAIKNMGEEAPYLALVGPSEAVEWADSLMAFAALYHNIIHKSLGMRAAINAMNNVNGFDNIFRLDLMHFADLGP
jgi:hypothetical protein